MHHASRNRDGWSGDSWLDRNLRRRRYRAFYGKTKGYPFWEFLCSLRGMDDLPTVIAESALDYMPDNGVQ